MFCSRDVTPIRCLGNQYTGTYFCKESCSCILNHDVFCMNQCTEYITIIRSFLLKFMMTICRIEYKLMFMYVHTSFTEVNRSVTPTIHFECHQPKLNIYLSRSSIRMPFSEANQSFVLVIPSDAISRS